MIGKKRSSGRPQFPEITESQKQGPCHIRPAKSFRLDGLVGVGEDEITITLGLAANGFALSRCGGERIW
jgi:hypothetical protein